MFGGGILYTAGAVVLAARRPDPAPTVFGYHEVWHTMVLAASVLHYVLIWRVVG
jgi:hemolysin III